MPYSEQQVTSKHQWSDSIFTFTTTRPEGFEFKNGQFVTLGLRAQKKLISRAYSIVSSNEDDQLEFLSIRIPDGPLTSELSQVGEGNPIWINTKSTGSLTLDHVLPGRHLYLFATGTGLAPFVSLLRGAEVFNQFEKVILIHTVREKKGLAYQDELEAIRNKKFIYLPTVTREEFETNLRGTELFYSGELTKKLELLEIDPQHDRVMICGNPNMNQEMTDYLNKNGWRMTNYQGVGNFTVEQAFVIPR